MTDIRWQLRLNSYTAALNQLGYAVSISKQRPLSELEKQSLIQAFRVNLVNDGDNWMEMIKSRNQISHASNQPVADQIANKTIHE